MRKHIKNTRTRYEFTFTKDGVTIFTIWFMDRKPTYNKVYRLLAANIDAILTACNGNQIELEKDTNGYTVAKCGDCIGKMTGNTLLQARGYK